MRLGSSILGGKPMRIPGVVDVYQVGDEWVARSWPKVQNQPNSAAQLLWRQRFKDAHATIKTWTGAHMAAWQAMNCPTGKMWIDIAMTSIMKNPTLLSTIPGQYDYPGGLRVRTKDTSFMHPGYYFGGTAWLFNIWWSLLFDPPYHIAGSQENITWADCGWICPNGKRPKKKWVPSYTGIRTKTGLPYTATGYGVTNYYVGLDPCPDGVLFCNITKWMNPVTNENEWAVNAPLIKFMPEPMTGDWW